jgi:hypothetical protein
MEGKRVKGRGYFEVTIQSCVFYREMSKHSSPLNNTCSIEKTT